MHEPGPRGRQDRVNRLALAACAVRYIRVEVEVRSPSGSVSVVGVGVGVYASVTDADADADAELSQRYTSPRRTPCQRPVLPHSAARLSYSGGVGGCPTSTRGKLQVASCKAGFFFFFFYYYFAVRVEYSTYTRQT